MKNSTIRGLVIEAGKPPRTATVKNDLKALQEIVGGSIECVYPWADPVVVVCNEEGKNKGLPANRALTDRDGKVYDILIRTFLLLGQAEDDFGSLSEELMKKYSEKFQFPEGFIRDVQGRLAWLRVTHR